MDVTRRTPAGPSCPERLRTSCAVSALQRLRRGNVALFYVCFMRFRYRKYSFFASSKTTGLLTTTDNITTVSPMPQQCPGTSSSIFQPEEPSTYQSRRHRRRATSCERVIIGGGYYNKQIGRPLAGGAGGGGARGGRGWAALININVRMNSNRPGTICWDALD
ncbi:hypothetical protein EVAR_49992_1 [Eumeta japonica]|uniref:Uncharacterized protein n=1 Tax=Eumeta variegata TaxID=151549 RepID=A0A4C1XSJ1_EUMVA|nr:hypothetical protein EVAR_49992_1 [Eumeta japonica]